MGDVDYPAPSHQVGKRNLIDACTLLEIVGWSVDMGTGMTADSYLGDQVIPVIFLGKSRDDVSRIHDASGSKRPGDIVDPPVFNHYFHPCSPSRGTKTTPPKDSRVRS